MKKLYFLFLLIPIIVLLNSCLEPAEDNTLIRDQIIKIDQHIKTYYPFYPAFYDASGIAFVVKKFGDLPPARIGQTMQLQIEGRVLESTNPFQDETLNTKLENISVEGLRFVLNNVMTGSEVVAFIPSEYAFKEIGNANVPPNSIVQYDFNLLSTQLSASELSRLESDTLAIRQYINENNLENVIRHPSGLYYQIEEEGSGVNPNVYNRVGFEYSGKLMVNGVVFDSGALNTLVFNLIDGIKIGLPLIKPGGRIILYIPSYLGYGEEDRPGIPGDSNLIFEIELTSSTSTN